MDVHEEYFRSLTQAEVQLLALREVLYDASWEEMIRDLEARRDGRPFVFKLRNRIDEDLERIRKLSVYEREHNTHLGKYVSQAALTGGQPEG